MAARLRAFGFPDEIIRDASASVQQKQVGNNVRDDEEIIIFFNVEVRFCRHLYINCASTFLQKLFVVYKSHIKSRLLIIYYSTIMNNTQYH